MNPSTLCAHVCGRDARGPSEFVVLLHVLVEKLNDLRVHAQPVIQLHKAVTLILKQNVLNRSVAFFQCFDDLLRLSIGHARIVSALQDEQRRADAIDVPLSDRDRNEVSGGLSYAVSPQVSVFGSVGHTIATLDQNGAGATVGAGVAFFVAPRRK